ncbi:MAG: hypothetical protein ACTH5W_15585 [Providencia sp.]|uniref:hypothetical protein n=1 Tax=Providencia sp. TaxID=589 RepID=UPI003F9E037A
MAKNEFLPFGTAEGANVLSNQEYERLAARFNGFISGVAKSKELNTVWRQSSVISSAIAQFIVDSDNKDLLDNGDVAGIKNRLVVAIKQIISGVGYVTTANMNLELNKKVDKANISGVKGDDNDKVPSLNLFTGEIGKLQPKGDYVLAGYSYSKTESDGKYQPKGNYAPSGDYVTTAALNNGLALKFDKTSIVQSMGTSTTQVMSQNSVTKSLNAKTDINVFQSKTESGNAVILPAGSPVSFIFNKDGSFYLYSFDSGNKFKINKDGEVTAGIIPFSRITGAPLLGIDQKWKTVTKQINTLYTNTTQKPIFVFAKSNASSNNFKIELEVDGVIASSTMVNGSGGSGTVTKELSCGAIVPSQSSYKFLVGGAEPAGVSISYAAELS